MTTRLDSSGPPDAKASSSVKWGGGRKIEFKDMSLLKSNDNTEGHTWGERFSQFLTLIMSRISIYY